jgi:hypothetical protein
MTFQNDPIWRPAQHEQLDLAKWRWEQYPILQSQEASMKKKMKRDVEKLKKKVSQE